MTHTSFSSSKGVISVLSALGAVATGLRGIPGDGESECASGVVGVRTRKRHFALEFELDAEVNKHTE